MGPVAIIGLGCRFPGAGDPGAFWRLLRDGVDAIREVPRDRWDIEAFYDPDPRAPGKMSTRWGGFLDGVDGFDSAFFGISDREAAVLDPQQRLLLEVAWEACEDAGLPQQRLSGSHAGVYIGISNVDHGRRYVEPTAIDRYDGMAVAASIVANRLSYFLDLRGPSVAVDTACSSSLVAVHLACQSLRAGECDIALAGGVNLILSPEATIAFSKAGMMAADGRCKALDAAADGYVRGEGAGIVVLKPLAAALRDGDRVMAVIRGSASNQDGRSNGLTAPNPKAQEAVVRQACRSAGIDPGQLQYVELHGTGTNLGDPIEARALGNVVAEGRGASPPCAIGSVKTNIGHLEAAAGIASLIKVVLAMEHRAIPASLHFERPNPNIPFDTLPLRVQERLGPWPAASSPLAGVSSFGFGGTNCHVILEAPPPAADRAVERDTRQRPEQRWHLLALSARTPEALAALAGSYAEFVVGDAPQLPALCHSANTGRTHFPYRLAVAARSVEELHGRLARAASLPASSRTKASRLRPRIAFLFTGQGSQAPGMARQLLETDPEIRATLEDCDRCLRSELDRPLLSVLLGSGDDAAAIHRTEYTQPALLALEVALARRWRAWGIEPACLLGHSLGEYAAACVAGAVSLEDALRLVAKRGRWMQALPEGGGMAAIFADEATVQRHLAPWRDTLEIAALNHPKNTVVSGRLSSLAPLLEALEREGVEAKRLSVDTPFHSAVLDPMLDDLERAAAAADWKPPSIPMVSNLTGELWAPGWAPDAGYWRRHSRAPVRFAQGCATLVAQGITHCVEIGPRPVLSALVQACPGGEALRCVPSLAPRREDAEVLLESLGDLYAAGAHVNWAAVSPPGQARAALPPYPFQRRRFPLAPRQPPPPPPLPVPAAAGLAAAGPAHVPDLRPHAEAPPPARGNALATIRELLGELLRTDPDRIDVQMPLLEMGADSLVLVDAVRRIEAEFGVKVGIRQLFEELSTIDALARWLEANAPTQPAGAVGPGREERAAPRGSRQVARVVDDAGLDARKRRHLSDLVTRYNARTRRSKELAARHRDVMADSRGAAGFRLTTKEMVYPIVGARGSGARSWDIDGNEYVDIAMGFGVHLFGHEPPFVMEALRRQIDEGFQLGPRAAAAGEVAGLICELTGMERVAFCTTGTEAVMTALRCARTVAKRSRVALFRGSYHGHFDGTLAEADPRGALPLGQPAVLGVTPGAVEDVLVLDYGAERSLQILREEAGELAAVLVEPVQSRHPDLQPRAFLMELREITRRAGAALIFDEMITGFRIHPGGAQAWFGVHADLVTYGKIVGGGLPIGVVAGRASFMDAIDGGAWRYGDASFPEAETTFFAGTFAKHPLTLATARAVLLELRRRGPALQEALNARTTALAARLNGFLGEAGVELRVAHFGSLFRFVHTGNLDPFFFHLVEKGIYVWEGRSCFLSTAHTDEDIDRVYRAVVGSVEELQEAGFLPPRPGVDAPPRRAIPAVRELPLSLAQKQLWALAGLSEAGSAAYHVPLLFELTGPLDERALGDALRETVARHDALRCAIQPDGERQRILPEIAIDLPIDDFSGIEGAARDALVAERLSGEVARRFDLARPPLLRARLLRLARERHLLLMVGHHIVLDGLSLQIVVGELSLRYPAAREGRSIKLPAPAQLGDLLAWQVTRPGTAGWQGDRDYWHRRFADWPPPLELPADRRRTTPRSFRGGRRGRRLGGPLLVTLRQLSLAQSCTPFMLFLSAQAVLLHRLTGADDLTIGVPAAGREMPGGAGVVGYCAHLLPIRFRFPRPEGLAPSFTSFLAAVRRDLLDAYEHAGYPFAGLLDDLAPARALDQAPLVGVTFNLDRVAALPRFGALEAALVSPPVAFSKLDLGINLTEHADEILVEIDYNADRFDAATIDRLLERFAVLLEDIAARPEAPIDELPVETPTYARFILHEWNDTARAFPGPATIHERFAQQVARTPDHLALVCGDDRLTYRALGARSTRLAQRLLAAGLPRCPRVALLLPRSTEMVVGLLGVLEAGGAYVPLEPELPGERVARMLVDADCHALVTLPGLAEAAGRRFSGAVLVLDELPPDPGFSVAAHRRAPDGEDVAYVLFTSGSTGRPKPVAVPHRAVASYVDGISERLELPASGVYATVSTFTADLGNTSVFPSLCRGGCLHVVTAAMASDAEGLAAWLEEHPIDCLKIVPSHLEALLAASRPERLLPRTHLILGGEPCRPGLLQALRRLSPSCRVFNHYGPTETTVGVLVGGPATWESADVLGIPLGRPLANSRVYVLDPALRLVPEGVSGELYIGGRGVAHGYLGRPELTAERFVPDPFSEAPSRLYRTGDRARMRPDGTLELLGRLDDQVKVRGHRVEPGEVAAALRGHPAVASAVVVPREAPSGGAQLIAYAVLARSAATAATAATATDERELQVFLRQLLPEPLVPARVVVLDALPLDANGKVDRRALPEPGPAAAASQVALPRSDIEHRLLAIWRGVLGQPNLGIRDNFFEAGGDSILSIQIAARAHQEGLRVEASQIYRHATVEALAAVVVAAPPAHAEQGLLAGEAPLTAIQRWFFEQEPANAAHWNMAVLLELEPGIGPELVAQAFALLARHHDALRLRFRRNASGWSQAYAGPSDPPLSVVDFDAGDGDAARRLQASLDLEHGPLVRLGWAPPRAGRGARLLIVVHHLAMDGISWRILLADLQTVLQRLQERRPVELGAKTTSFREWAERLSTYARSEALRREQAYWLLAASLPPARLPRTRSAGENRVRSMATVTTALDRAETDVLLRGGASAYRTEINDLLLTALVRAFSAWTGEATLLVDLEGHGREPLFEAVDLSRTVGWFTSRFPVWLDLEGITEDSAAIQAIKEQLRAVPGRGLGYGLLRYLGPEDVVEALSAGAAPEVSFNYLGQFDEVLPPDALFRFTDGERGPERDPDGLRRHLISVDGMVLGGQLRLEWSYAGELFDRAVVERLAGDYLDSLRALLAHCLAVGQAPPAPSDFADVALDQRELADLFAQVGAAASLEGAE